MIRELEQQYIRLKWLMTARLMVVTVSLALGIALLGVPLSHATFLNIPATFYSYIAFYYIISILYIIFLQKSTHYIFFGIFQIFIDLMAVTSIVIIADPIESVFPNLYIVVIILSNIMYIRHAGLITVCLSIILYLGTVIFSYYNTPNYFSAYKEYGIYVVYIEITTFICVGYLAHYLSSLLRKKTIELKQLEKESDYVFHHIKSGVFLVNKNNSVYYANRAATSILSCSENDLIDIGWRQILNIESILTDEKIKLEEGNEIELVAFDFNGKEIPLAITFSPINSPIGVEDYYIVLFRDLTEHRNSEQSILESERLRTIVDLSSSVAHEIGNPLASISGSAELLEMKIEDPDKKKHLKVISDEVERLTSIVHDFLSFTRLRSLEFVEFNINDLVTDIIVLLHHSKKLPENMKLLYQEPEEPILVFADKNQIKQVLLNLGLNALQAMPDGGSLEFQIVIDDKNKFVITKVKDTGHGITDEVREKMFDSFYTTKQSSSGIGLYVTQSIIRSHKGKISVESEIGKGTTFAFSLPLKVN